VSELITTKQAASLLGLDETNVRRHCRMGQLKAQKFGHIWMIAREDLDEFSKVPRRRGPKKKETEMTQGNYTISDEKLAQVMDIVNRDIDPAATEDLIKSEICADWNEGDEHQEWIDSAMPDEIADWLASFYGDNDRVREIIVWDGADYGQNDGYYYQVEDVPGGNAYGEPFGPFVNEDEARGAAKASLRP
jgi:excisionase family DNA binding protein